MFKFGSLAKKYKLLLFIHAVIFFISSPTLTLAKGVWISEEEIVQIPSNGPTWAEIENVAQSDVGNANLADQSERHGVRVLAIALFATRLNNDSFRLKAVNEMMEAIGTENNPDPNCVHGKEYGARSLALARNLIAYVIAADILDFREDGYDPFGKGSQFQDWVDKVRFRKNCPNTPDGEFLDLSETHDGAASNGNALAGASRAAAAAYLGDRTELDKAWLTFLRYTGDTSIGPNLSFNSGAESWLHTTNKSLQSAINPKNATCNDKSYPADGVIPNDQGRGGPCPSNENDAPSYTQYPWEGIQGIFAQALIFDRMGYQDSKGKNPWETNDKALMRAVEYQWILQQKFGGDWFNSQRAAWAKHLANFAYSTNYPASPYGGGRNMDWTQWTHQDNLLEIVVTPTINPDGGNFSSSVKVNLSTTTSGATIYYTTNGTTPKNSSIQYSAPFTLTQTTTVKAIAVKSGFQNSNIAQATFTKVVDECVGNVNFDNEVNIFDIIEIIKVFEKSCGDIGFNERADVKEDCAINIFDIIEVIKNFGDC